MHCAWIVKREISGFFQQIRKSLKVCESVSALAAEFCCEVPFGCDYAMFCAVLANGYPAYGGRLFDQALLIRMYADLYLPTIRTEAATLASSFGHTTSVLLTHDDALYMHSAGTVNCQTMSVLTGWRGFVHFLQFFLHKSQDHSDLRICGPRGWS
jgi:hypothetical protein